MDGTCRLNLLGPLSLMDPAGADRTPSSAKDCAVLAMVATAPNARRGRAWLKDRLWSTKSERQAAASLRQAIYGIRKALGPYKEMIYTSGSVVCVDTSKVTIDINDPDWNLTNRAELPDFLEGIDIEDAEFEEWLRDHRAYWHSQLSREEEEDEELGPSETASDRPQRSPVRTREGLVTSPPAVGALFGPSSIAGPLRLAIAVLPLQNNTFDPQLTFFSDGISEDLIERLSCLRWLPVIARSSTFAVRPLKRDLVAVSDTLRARYILDGDVRADGDDLVIRVFLNNMENSDSIWCSSYQVPKSINKDALEEILREIVSQTGDAIDKTEQHRGIQGVTRGAVYDEHLWRGRWHLSKLTARDSQLARTHLNHALQENPGAAEVLMQDAQWHVLRLWTGRGTQQDIMHIQPAMRRAQQADTSDARGYAMLGITELWLKNHEVSADLFGQALQRNPSFAKAHEQLGTCYYLMGRPQEAIKSLEEAIRLSPNDQHLFFLLGELAMSKFMAGQHRDAVRLASQALIYRPKFWYAHMIKLAALDAVSDHSAYQKAQTAFRSAGIHLQDSDFDWIPFQDQAWVRLLRNHASL